MYCPKCGNEVKDNEQFCSVCGYRLQNNRAFDSPQNPNYSSNYQAETENKGHKYSKAVAIVLALLLGEFGAHNFYLKRYPFAIAQLSSFIIIAALYIFLPNNGYIYIINEYLSAALGIWILVEFIQILNSRIKIKDGYLD